MSIISRDSEVVERIRRFDRFYEKRLRKAVRAATNEDFSAADIRVLSELDWANGGCSGTWLSFRLDLDNGYVFRVLKKLEAWELIAPGDPLPDARTRTWDLTWQGREFARQIEKEYRDRVVGVLFDVLPSEQARLVEAMRVIEEILGKRAMLDAQNT